MKLDWIIIPIALVTLASCDFVFGTRQDKTVDEVFDQGAIDPNLSPDQVGYVPVFPFWDGFSNPVDVYVGYDEMVYVVDDNGLSVLDQTGTVHDVIPIMGAVEVIQDRRLHTYVAGRAIVEIEGAPRNVAAVYHLSNTATASPVQFLDTLIHPLADESRKNTAFRGADDEAVEFTGLATLADNTLYVSRIGPRNNIAGIARPDNAVLFFDEDGENISYAAGLNPVSSSLKSILGPTSIASFAAPPQSLFGINESEEFILAQGSAAAEFKVLWITKFVDPDAGIEYRENAELVLQDTSKADAFLYEPSRFAHPADVFIAPDFTGYIFVVDSDKDSVYQFTQKGYEGVNSPATTSLTKQIIASFGGTGEGPFEFVEPSGVCYFRETVYVADKGNSRICRFKLSTDLEG